MTPSTTALVLIDLQQGILARALAPHSADTVAKNAAALLSAARAAGLTVVLVRVGFHADGRDRLQPPVDRPMPAGPMPPNWLEFIPAIVPAPSDLLVLKHQWGAVHGTDLDTQLRRRGIQTVILGGVATNMGVESTARDLWELGYQLIFAEDAMTSRSAEMHSFAVKQVFPMIGQVRSAEQILEMFA